MDPDPSSATAESESRCTLPPRRRASLNVNKPTHNSTAHTAESAVAAQQLPGMDASTAAAWSWPRRLASPAINKHTYNRRSAYNNNNSSVMLTAPPPPPPPVQQLVVVHKRIRKATGPPPLEPYFFKRMCRRTSPNNTITTNINNNNNVAVGGNYSLPFQRWPTYRTATSTMETLPGNRATSAMETLSGNRATTAAAAATAASAIENLRVGRATTAATTTTTTATALMQTLPIEILKQIGAFAGGCFSLGETCKANLEVTSELHYAINIMENAYSFSAAEDPMGALSNRHMMGMKPPGASFSFFANHNAHDPSGGSLLSNRHMMGGGGVKPPLGLGVLPNRDMAGG